MRSGFLALLVLACACGALAQPVAPFVVAHPASFSVYPDDPVTLSATIEGTAPINYQWKKDGVAVAGATNPSLSLVAAIPPGSNFSSALYELVASNVAGSVTTIGAVVFVTKRPQTITFPSPAAPVPSGTTITLAATASSGLAVSYSLVSGAGSLSGNVIVGSGGPLVVRASQAGNGTFAAADVVERTFNFVSGALSPFLTTVPADTTALAGTALSFRATAVGTPAPTYQWKKDGALLAGATSSTLAFASLTLADAGSYTVTATNLAGTASATAQLVVRAGPVITAGPVSQTAPAGTAVTLTVESTGFPAPTYQWRRNGTAIAGATASAYTLAAVTAGQAGSYDVVATNPHGTATSAPATLTVVTRDFSGTYLGRFVGQAGDAVLVVRANGTAAFFGHLPALAAGLTGLNVNLSLTGVVSGTLSVVSPSPQAVTLTGTVDEATGQATGTLTELGVSFTATRAIPRDPLLASAGIYTAALVGSATGQGHVIVAPDGQAFLITAAGTTADSARGSLDERGRLLATTATRTEIDVGFTDGALRGTVRTPAATAGTIAGAIEGLAGLEHLANLSIRSVTTPVSPMIMGFVIGGTTAKQVLVRAAGPALGRAPFNLPSALADPVIQLYRASTAVGANNDWGTPGGAAAAITAAATRVGAFPFAANSADSALLTTLQPGVYSVQIGGGTGTVLAEIYEVAASNETPGSRRLINASTLGVVTPDLPLIAGFVVSGTAPQRVLIRAAGPTLAGAPFNVAGTLANPRLTLFRGTTALRTNDDWFRDAEAPLVREAATRARAFAFGGQSLDAALLTFLEPGAYTAVVQGPANAAPAAGTGVVLVEIYEATP